jgi:anti-sigma regulatory factor (Ser/Thr protein kinase)
MELVAEPRVLVQVRHALRRWLRAHDATGRDIAALTLAVGEAAANAIEHAYAPTGAVFEIEALHAAGTVTLAVRDSGNWREPRGVHRGRGLKMIEATVDDVDVTVGENGTQVVMHRRLGS